MKTDIDLRFLNNNEWIITPNSQTALQILRQQFEQTTNGQHKKPNVQNSNVLIFHNWLHESAQSDKAIASESQMLFIWQKVISQFQENDSQLSLLNPKQLAQAALSAWQVLKRWQVSINQLKQHEQGQLIQFHRWCLEFERQLNRMQLCTLEMSVEQLLKHKNATTSLKTIICYAFVEPLAPLWQRWLSHHFQNIESVAYTGVQLIAGANATEQNSELVLCQSYDDELLQALNWAKNIQQQNQGNIPRIAIIDLGLSNNLQTNQKLVASFYSEESMPKYSRQPALEEHGGILTALNLIKLNRENIDLATARFLAQSPLWGSSVSHDNHSSTDNTYNLRAEWDVQICNAQLSNLKTRHYIQLLTRDQTMLSAQSSQVLSEQLITQYCQNKKKYRSPSQWASLFQKQTQALMNLEALCDSSILSRWSKALDVLISIETVSNSISFEQAYSLLADQCKKIEVLNYAAQQGLQFLDTIEAASDYNHIWIMGMDSNQWPGRPSPNPLIPNRLSQEHKLPRSNPQNEVELAEKLLLRLTTSASKLVFSYSQYDVDMPQDPSPMLLGIAKVTPADQQQHKPSFDDRKQVNNAVALPNFEWIDCTNAPAISPTPHTVRSGANLLKSMAISPFHSFIQWRLGCSELAKPQIGFSALDRGNFIHEILQEVWLKLKTHKELVASSQEKLLDTCQVLANLILNKWRRQHSSLPQVVVEIEIERLANICCDWLALEKQRSAFEVIQIEQALSYQCSGLNIRLRLDRVDQLSNGELVLIDYKTAKVLGRNGWVNEPFEQPQLPLYVLAMDEAVRGICFAQIRSEVKQFVGIGEQIQIDGFNQVDDWQGLIEQWHQSLSELAQQYTQGSTIIFPNTSISHTSIKNDPYHSITRCPEITALQQAQEIRDITQ